MRRWVTTTITIILVIIQIIIPNTTYHNTNVRYGAASASNGTLYATVANASSMSTDPNAAVTAASSDGTFIIFVVIVIIIIIIIIVVVIDHFEPKNRILLATIVIENTYSNTTIAFDGTADARRESVLYNKISR